ncbi:MAG TPA: N-acetylmuramoyl-L-alanine amidase, partial [Thermoanaerobaculia bacterium]|nr:N-acetylmuramoyl-L-alanine amidase [Thermoanaerobaculia bacterium]
LSLHADSLHPSVRGAMAYVPGERFLRERYGRATPFYRTFREVRDDPVVSFTKKERVLAEGASTSLAEQLIGAFRRRGLPVHQFRPVRTHVIRKGQEWVPAVLRYNKIPNRVLFELSNLSNEEDRKLTLTRAYRQECAEALADGLVAFFGGAAEERAASPGRMTPQAVDEVAPAEVSGPWPDTVGPWPQGAPQGRTAISTTATPTPTPTPTKAPRKPVRRRR